MNADLLVVYGIPLAAAAESISVLLLKEKTRLRHQAERVSVPMSVRMIQIVRQGELAMAQYACHQNEGATFWGPLNRRARGFFPSCVRIRLISDTAQLRHTNRHRISDIIKGTAVNLYAWRTRF